MLLHSLRAFCKAPGGAGSIWKYLEALEKATGMSQRFAYGFRTEFHFADQDRVPCICDKWQSIFEAPPDALIT